MRDKYCKLFGRSIKGAKVAVYHLGEKAISSGGYAAQAPFKGRRAGYRCWEV